MEGGIGRPDHAAIAAAGLLDGLGQRTLHDGRGLLEGRAQGIRRSSQGRVALSRQAPCELGSRPRHRDQRSRGRRSEEHTSELQSLMRISYAVFCLKKKTNKINSNNSKLRTRHNLT